MSGQNYIVALPIFNSGISMIGMIRLGNQNQLMDFAKCENNPY